MLMVLLEVLIYYLIQFARENSRTQVLRKQQSYANVNNSF